MKELFKKKFNFLTKDQRKKKTLFLISLSVHFFAIFTAFLYPALEVYLNNVADFDFTFGPLLLTIGLFSLLFLGVGIGLSMLLRGRLFNYYVTFVFSFALCSYLQGSFMNSSLPSLDGNAVQWHMLTGTALVNLLVWAILFFIPFIIHFFHKDFWAKALIYVSCLCIVMTAVSLFSAIAAANLKENENKGFYSRDNLYDVSNEGDVVVFILDYYDNRLMEADLAEYPELLSEFTGFTRFTNCTSMYKQTMPSIPYILSQTKWYCETGSWNAAYTCFSQSEFLPRIKATGASIDLYVSGTANSNHVYPLVNNYNSSGSKVDPIGMLKSMGNYILYRNMPTITKSVFWHYTDDISNGSVKTDNLSDKETIYTIDDALLLDELEENSITTRQGKGFKFIHMRGAHYPHILDENGNRSGSTTAHRQRRGTVHVVSEYLKEMKEKGVYDNTTIIVMADHGEVVVADEATKATIPILLVKPAGADSAAELKTSNAPVSQEDFHSTVLWALGDPNYSDFGRTFFEIGENEKRVRNFYFRVAYDGKTEESLIEYEIIGDAKDFSNWRKTGRVWGDLAKAK